VIDHTKTLEQAYKLVDGALDKTGVGETLYESISHFIPRIKGITLTAGTKEELMSALQLDMERRAIILPLDNRRLLSQITSQEATPGDNGRLKFTHPAGANDDLLWALALAAYAARNAPPSLGYVPI
jgi:phage FluMu gp28-like protein